MKKQYFNRPFSGYWTVGDCLAVDLAQTYHDLFVVAIEVLKTIPQPVVQFCGPISTGGKGSIDANLAELDRAILSFASKGVYIFDQIPFEEPMQRIKPKSDGYNYDLLNQFYLPLSQSGLIKKFIFLPGWESSEGARWEDKQAEKLAIKREYLPDDWYEKNYDLIV